MPYNVVYPIVVAVLLAFFVPGSAEIGRAQQQQEIKISMLAPRESLLFSTFKKLGDKIERLSKGTYKVRLYPFGVAGDEKDVIRKMSVGQMDGAVITTTGLSVIEPQMAIIDAPGLIMGYKDLEGVEKVLDKEIPEFMLKKKIKVLTSWEAGQYRVFHNDAKGLIIFPEDFKKHRVWVWPENYILKEMYREAGATGVPLAVPDVFGALTTGMIDTLTATANVTVQMRWHTQLNRVSERAQGVLLFFWVMNQAKWEAIPAEVQKMITNELAGLRSQARIDARKSDQDAFNALVKRGYKPVRLTPVQDAAWTNLFNRVIKKLNGRLWPDSFYKKLAAAKRPAA